MFTTVHHWYKYNSSIVSLAFEDLLNKTLLGIPFLLYSFGVGVGQGLAVCSTWSQTVTLLVQLPGCPNYRCAPL